MSCKVLIFLILIVSIASCSSSYVLINDLVLSHSIYYHADKLFTGIAVDKFEDGKIANKINFKNGIPDGKWIAYGYEGEIVQEGSYRPIAFDSSNNIWMKGINRITICLTVEGKYRFTDVFIRLSNAGKIKLDSLEIKDNVINYLKNSSSNRIEGRLRDVKFASGELQEY